MDGMEFLLLIKYEEILALCASNPKVFAYYRES